MSGSGGPAPCWIHVGQCDHHPKTEATDESVPVLQVLNIRMSVCSDGTLHIQAWSRRTISIHQYGFQHSRWRGTFAYFHLLSLAHLAAISGLVTNDASTMEGWRFWIKVGDRQDTKVIHLQSSVTRCRRGNGGKEVVNRGATKIMVLTLLWRYSQIGNRAP